MNLIAEGAGFGKSDSCQAVVVPVQEKIIQLVVLSFPNRLCCQILLGSIRWIEVTTPIAILEPYSTFVPALIVYPLND